MYREYLPDIRLQHLIETFWVSDAIIKTPRHEKIMPDGCVDIIFNFESYNSGRQFHEIPELVGTMTSLLELYYLPGHIEMLGIRFAPGGITAFTDMPVNEITNLHVDLTQTKTLFDADLHNRLPEIRNMQERIDYLNRYFVARLSKLFQINPQIQHTVSLIRSTNGLLSVKQLAHETCLCERQLERKFKAMIGISPKLFSNVMRFRAARRYAKAYQTDSLYSIAIACGYHDHSHMHKEFRRLGNISPSDLFT